MSNTPERDSASANLPTDPLKITRDARRVMACSRGLFLLLTSPLLLALGALELSGEDTSGNLTALITIALGLFLAFGPKIISRIRARQGMRFQARGENLRRTITPRQAILGIGIALAFFVLIGILVWWTEGSALVPYSAIAGIFMLFSLSPFIRFAHLRLWEDLCIGLSLLAAAGTLLIKNNSKESAVAFLILGICSLVAGASLERRWRHWSRQATVDDPSSEPKPEQ